MRHFGTMLLAYALICFIATAHAQGTEPDLKIGPSGAASINKSTPFKLPLIKSLFPQYTVTEGTENWEGDPFPVIYVNDGKERLLTITGSAEGIVGNIWTSSQRVPSTFGVTVGTAYRQLFRDLPTKRCSTGTENYSGTLLCSAPEDESVTYQFAGKMNGADLPPPQALRAWRISRIIWLNPDVK